MYCVKCGVELADSQDKCPLCLTPVYYPNKDKDADKPYPPKNRVNDQVSTKGFCFIATFLCFIAMVVCVACDVQYDMRMSWSGYVIGAIVLSYVIAILPTWFRRWHPIIFIPCDFLAIALFLMYICYATGGKWFWSFALPLTASIALIVSTVVILSTTIRRGYLYISAGAFIATGWFSILIEFLSNITFPSYKNSFTWSLYPAITLTLFGIMLIVIAIVKPFRESLSKFFAF